MAKTFYHLLKEARPRQWIKNLIVFAPIFFTGQLDNPIAFQSTLIAFFAFCTASSSVYFINDLIDIEKDQEHPFKKNRPIASGKINIKLAKSVATVLIIISYLIGLTVSPTPMAFILTLSAFLLLHFAYSLKLKNMMLLDILTIAAGFILRVWGGEMATGYHISIWLFLTVISGSLFLAIGKRRSELTLLTGWAGGNLGKTRATLSRYSEKMLDVYISMFANSTWITYAFYSFLERPPVFRKTFSSLLTSTDLTNFQDRKWLMITIPFVIYGIMRYLQLIYERNQGESPEKVLLSDKPLMATVIILALLLTGIIYIIGK